MKLASLKGGRDGRLVVVSNDLERCMAATDVASTLQAALDNWSDTRPTLEALSARVNAGEGEPFPVLAGEAFRKQGWAQSALQGQPMAGAAVLAHHVQQFRLPCVGGRSPGIREGGGPGKRAHGNAGQGDSEGMSKGSTRDHRQSLGGATPQPP